MTTTRTGLLSLVFVSLLSASKARTANQDLGPRQAAVVQECIVRGAGDITVDDSAAIVETFQRCSSNSIIRLTATNYTVYTPISLTGLGRTLVFVSFWDSMVNHTILIHRSRQCESTLRRQLATPARYGEGADRYQ